MTRVRNGLTPDSSLPQFLPETPNSGVVTTAARSDDGRMKKQRLPRPYCRAIDPDSDEKGYYCRRCGYSLIETRTGWFRHGDEWRHPEAWR